MPGKLYLVSIPIGNPDDITVRAIKVLKTVDYIVLEEQKEGAKFLRYLDIQSPTELLNEHNEENMTEVLLDYLNSGKNVAVISDSGTPVFSDPGRLLVQSCHQQNIRVIPIPGASSLMPALIVSGFPIDNFLYYGWLSPKTDVRKNELRSLKREKRTIVILDTPYRLKSLVRDLKEIFTDTREICVAYNITLADEKIILGNPSKVYNEVIKNNLKGEFVLLISGIE